MRLLAKFEDQKDGGYSRVFEDHKRLGYLVQFSNTFDQHMDGSDYSTKSYADAMNHAGEEHPDMIRII
jgi:hypothetical protein